MKKLDAEWAAKQTFAERPPMPFPGRYPTRFLLVSRKVTYFGKPSKNLADLVMKLNKARLGAIAIHEVDRAGTVAHTVRLAPAASFPATAVNQALWVYYHPFQSATDMLIYLGGKWQTKKILFQGKIHRVYAPFPGKIKKEQLQNHKAWLNTNAKRLGYEAR